VLLPAGLSQPRCHRPCVSMHDLLIHFESVSRKRERTLRPVQPIKSIYLLSGTEEKKRGPAFASIV